MAFTDSDYALEAGFWANAIRPYETYFRIKSEIIQKACAFTIKAFVIALMVLAPLFAFIFLQEFYMVGIKAETGGYPFGSEHAIYVGGAHYATAEQYARTALLEGILYLAISILIYLAVILKRPVFAIAAAVVFLIAIIVGNFPF